MKLLPFLFGWRIYKAFSVFVAIVLRWKGVKVGKNFYTHGIPYLKIRGNPRDIIIGNNVSIYGDIDIRNREHGKIIFSDNVAIDRSSRFVAANRACLKIESGCRIGPYSIFNCGDDVIIGNNTLIAGFCYVQSSNHGIKKGELIKNQKHTYGKITIGKDVWIGGHVNVLAGVSIGDGAVVGAKAVVTKDIPSNAIAVGVPARVVAFRE